MTQTQKLKPGERKLLDWVTSTDASGGLLESQVIGSGLSKALNELLLKGLVEMVEHPTVKEGRDRKTPAAAVRLRRL